MIKSQSKVSTEALGAGDAGRIVVRADDVTLDGGFISSTVEPDSTGDAGKIVVTADDLTLDVGQISSDTVGEGDAGGVAVTADDLTVRDGGQIAATPSAEAPAGGWS